MVTRWIVTRWIAERSMAFAVWFRACFWVPKQEDWFSVARQYLLGFQVWKQLDLGHGCLRVEPLDRVGTRSPRRVAATGDR